MGDDAVSLGRACGCNRIWPGRAQMVLERVIEFAVKYLRTRAAMPLCAKKKRWDEAGVELMTSDKNFLSTGLTPHGRLCDEKRQIKIRRNPL